MIGTLHAVGYSVVWVIFEGAVLRPLVMPAAGLMVVVPLIVWRRAFTVE